MHRVLGLRYHGQLEGQPVVVRRSDFAALRAFVVARFANRSRSFRSPSGRRGLDSQSSVDAGLAFDEVFPRLSEVAYVAQAKLACTRMIYVET